MPHKLLPSFEINSEQNTTSKTQYYCTNNKSCCLSKYHKVDAVKTGLSPNRFYVCSFEQVSRLDKIMEGEIAINGKNQHYPTINLKLKTLVKLVKHRLQEAAIAVKDVRMNGGAASYVVGSNCDQTFKDIDILFSVELSDSTDVFTIRSVVLDVLSDFLADEHGRGRFNSAAINDGYVQKQVRIQDSTNSWSLMALGTQIGNATTIELKFVEKLARQFEFTVDSFQIILDSLLAYYLCDDLRPIDENFYPTLVAESIWGNFDEALYHLDNKIIFIKNPEEIRGGGLLKYCKLLADGYSQSKQMDVYVVQKYMCSRFFIDFPNLDEQRRKIFSYLQNHFHDHDVNQVSYLMNLHSVISHSAVCLMNSERYHILHAIQCLIKECRDKLRYLTSVVHFDRFSSRDWSIDGIFYGTDYFPKPQLCKQLHCTPSGRLITINQSEKLHSTSPNSTMMLSLMSSNSTSRNSVSSMSSPVGDKSVIESISATSDEENL